MLIITLGLTVGTYLHWKHIEDDQWVFIGLLIFSGLSLFGFISQFFTQLTIYDDHILIRTIVGVEKYQKEKIKNVHIAKGCPVILILENEKKLELPDLNISPHNLANIIRPWLKKQNLTNGSN